MAAVDAQLPPGIAGFDAFLRRPPFDGIDPVEQMLTSKGFRAVETVTHDVETIYRSPEQWWTACQSQAPWAVSWRHIPPGQREEGRRDAFSLLQELQAPNGTVTRTLTFACTTAEAAP